MPEPVEYMDLVGIAARLDVAANTVYQWRFRYRDRDPRWPAPDVVVGRLEGWHPDRLDEIRAWMDARPGQGAEGGRHRKDRPAP